MSFVGFAPSRKPKFAIIVVVDSPRGVPAYGGTVAAPIFHRIAQAALQHYGVQRTINAPPPLIVERRAPYSGDPSGAPNAPTPTSGPAEPPTVLPAGTSASGGEPVVPDLTGMSGRDAVRLLATLGLSVQVSRARARHRPAAAAGNAGAGGGLGARMAGPACAGGWAESARSMTVRELLRSIAALVPAEARGALDAPGLDVPCTGVAYDSRIVTPGAVFVALLGQRADGAAFAPQAVSAGAAAVVAAVGVPPVPGTAWLPVSDPRLALALLAAEFNGHPSRAMRVVGVTGTNGKTTTGYLVRAILEAAGIKCGLMGTVAYCIGDRVIEASRTTPEAPDVQAFLRQMHDEACGACVMEVSSHALALRRVDGLEFAAGVFTNLTRDHLDFHVNMEGYFAAKRRLFEMLPPRRPGGHQPGRSAGRGARRGLGLARDLRHQQAGRRRPRAALVLARGSHLRRADAAGDRARDAPRSSGGPTSTTCSARSASRRRSAFRSTPSSAASPASRACPAGSRWCRAPSDDITVIVDYAHTDDALRNLLETARPMATRRLITVFGAGGERDRTKRPLMGMVAARLSDVVVITSDNPRGEDPAQIIEEVMRGAEPEARQSNARALTVVDRREAIHQAIAAAAAGDVVLIAGKGHEKYQVIGGTTFPFDDVAVAREALARPAADVGGRVSAVALTLGWIAGAVAGARVAGAGSARTDTPVREVVTDSRAHGGRRRVRGAARTAVRRPLVCRRGAGAGRGGRRGRAGMGRRASRGRRGGRRR